MRAAMADGDTSVVMVGQTFGNFNGINNGDWDIVVLKLDAATGTEIWRLQVYPWLQENSVYDQTNAAIQCFAEGCDAAFVLPIPIHCVDL